MKLWHVYVTIAAVAFVLTGSQALAYFDAGPVGGTINFWQDALGTNNATRFPSFDISFLGLAVFVVLWVESRRVGIDRIASERHGVAAQRSTYPRPLR
jgi:hypothetical protein